MAWFKPYFLSFFTDRANAASTGIFNNTDGQLDLTTEGNLDLLLLLVLFFHRSSLKNHGLWISKDEQDEQDTMTIGVGDCAKDTSISKLEEIQQISRMEVRKEDAEEDDEFGEFDVPVADAINGSIDEMDNDRPGKSKSDGGKGNTANR